MQDETARADVDPAPAREQTNPWLQDFLASVVVFLVALPLCIGIAVACGVPPERGLITGIVGGIVVGVISGAPLLVSGPAASLIVLVAEIVSKEGGLIALAPIVMMAGVWQLIAGTLKLGQWFKAVAPAVIQGMLIGIGVIIFCSQLHVAVDVQPKSGFIANLLALPATYSGLFKNGLASAAPLAVGGGTILLMLLWTKYRPEKLKLVPGQLVALVIVAAAAGFGGAKVIFLEMSDNFFQGLRMVTVADMKGLLSGSAIVSSFIFAFVASAATLLTAAAIDQRQTHSQADYNKEMRAQGLGNLCSGFVGGLPMTGVIVRSSVNVDAGARTRGSTIMHGIWLLIFVTLAPNILELIPRASLGAILVVTGWKLMDVEALKRLYSQGRSELVICLITLVGVVGVDLFSGIIAGLVAAVIKLVYTFTSMDLRSEVDEELKTHHLHLAGSATFVRLPFIADALNEVADDNQLQVHINRLDHIDHACLELLSGWNQRREQLGQPGMLVEWSELSKRYREAVSGTRQARPSKSLLRVVWEEWKWIYRGGPEVPAVQRWLEPERVSMGHQAEKLDDVLRQATRLLAPHTDLDAESILAALRERPEGHIGLGEGVSLPHAPIAGLKSPQVALITTQTAIEVDGVKSDVFFVVLAPEDNHHDHLTALARVGRLCHNTGLLEQLRHAKNADEAVKAVAATETALTEEPPSGQTARQRVLAVIEVAHRDSSDIANIIAEKFGQPVKAKAGEVSFDMVASVLGLPKTHQALIVSLEVGDLPVVRALLREQVQLEPNEVARLHILRGAAGQSIAA